MPDTTNDKKRTKRSIPHQLKNHPFVVPVLTLLFLFGLTLIGFVSMGGQTIGASDTRIVKLTIDGEQQVVPTRAATVRDLLERLDVKLKDTDVVTPGLDTEIYEDNTEVTVKHSRAVLIVDGNKKTLTYSAAESADEVARKAGINIYPEDYVNLRPLDPIKPTEALAQGIVAEQVVIDRATPTRLNLYGAPTEIRTRARTVGELLDEKKVTTAPDDTVTPARDTPLTPNTQIFVVRVGKQVVSVEETIAAPEEVINDPALTAGTTQVREAGANGKKIMTYELELRNGVEVSRKPIQEVLVSAPVKRVVVRGSKVVYSNPSANVALGQEIAAQMGWGNEFSCIYQIFQRESGWNHLARNRSSGAYGIPQALPGSKMGPGWESDPAVQIRWGIGYMVNRYGSPCKAQAFWNVNHWY